MRWEIGSLIGSLILGGFGLLAQAAETAAPGIVNIEGLVGTGGALALLAWLVTYMVTKQGPRQDERFDAVLKANRDDHTAARKDYLQENAAARSEYLKQIDEHKKEIHSTLARLAESVDTLSESVRSRP